MVVNGFILDEAYGEIDTKLKKKKTKKRERESHIEIDKDFKDSSNTIGGFVQEGDNSFYGISNDYFINQQKMNQSIENRTNYNQKYQQHIQNNMNGLIDWRDKYILNSQEYEEYIELKKNKLKCKYHPPNKDQVVEGFSNINDNFNDILLFSLYGIFFLLFTDYIYKLGKKSY